MAWFRLDDNGYDHDKVEAAGNRAYGAWCRAGQYASNKRTDGVVSLRAARKIDADSRVWKRLVRVGLLHEVDSGYVIHDYLDYNPSKAQLDAKTKARSAAGKRGADSRWDGKRDGNCHSKSHGTRHNSGNAPVPSRPDPTRPIEIPAAPQPAPLTLTGIDVPESDQKPQRKEPTGPHAEVVAHWCSAFQASRGRAYKFQAARDGASVKKLLLACDGDATEAKRLIDSAFADGWWCDNVTITKIANDPNTFATLKAKGPRVQSSPGPIPDFAEYDLTKDM